MTESNFKGPGNESRDHHRDDEENVNTDDKTQLVESGVEERKERRFYSPVLALLHLNPRPVNPAKGQTHLNLGESSYFFISTAREY